MSEDPINDWTVEARGNRDWQQFLKGAGLGLVVGAAIFAESLFVAYFCRSIISSRRSIACIIGTEYEPAKVAAARQRVVVCLFGMVRC